MFIPFLFGCVTSILTQPNKTLRIIKLVYLILYLPTEESVHHAWDPLNGHSYSRTQSKARRQRESEKVEENLSSWLGSWWRGWLVWRCTSCVLGMYLFVCCTGRALIIGTAFDDTDCSSDWSPPKEKKTSFSIIALLIRCCKDGYRFLWQSGRMSEDDIYITPSLYS